MAFDPVTYKGAVYPWHCDHMGHMNVMWYVGKFDEATWNLFAGLGLSAAFLRAHNRGMAAVQQNITYSREAMPGDVLVIESAVLEIRERVIRFSHRMRDGETGEAIAHCELTAVHMDLSVRQSTAFPDAARQRAAALIAPI